MISFTSMRDVSGCVWRTGWRGREWKQKAQSQAPQQWEPEVVAAGLWEEAETGDKERRQVAGLGTKFERRMDETCPLCPPPSDSPGLSLYVPAMPPSPPLLISVPSWPSSASCFIVARTWRVHGLPWGLPDWAPPCILTRQALLSLFYGETPGPREPK